VVIDMFALALIPGVPLTLLLGDRTVTRDPYGTSVSYDWQLNGKGVLVWVALAFGYFIFCEAMFGGTLGKRRQPDWAACGGRAQPDAIGGRLSIGDPVSGRRWVRLVRSGAAAAWRSRSRYGRPVPVARAN
jgi:hypothetical protein